MYANVLKHIKTWRILLHSGSSDGRKIRSSVYLHSEFNRFVEYKQKYKHKPDALSNFKNPFETDVS